MQESASGKEEVSSLLVEVKGFPLEVDLDGKKADMVELEKVFISDCCRRNDEEISEQELTHIAVMAVEMGSSHVVELFSPQRAIPFLPQLWV